MPLQAQITRDDEPMSLRWGWWHVECMIEAADKEGVLEDLLKTKGSVVLTQEHSFLDESDGEILDLKVGDKLSLWRSYGN